MSKDEDHLKGTPAHALAKGGRSAAEASAKRPIFIMSAAAALASHKSL